MSKSADIPQDQSLESSTRPRTLRRIIFALFVLYITAVIFTLIIPNAHRSGMVLVGGLTWERWVEYLKMGLNLVPFHSLAEQVTAILSGQSVGRGILYLVGNFLGFFPLGFFLPVLFARMRRFGTFLLVVVAGIALLELIQVLTMRGHADIDDLILNTLGACLGYSCVSRGTCNLTQF